MMSDVGDQEENPAEPVPDVATVAEPPQPPEPAAEDEALITTPTSSNTAENPPTDVSRSNLQASVTELRDQFAQTFIKFAKNLSNRRLIEIINTQIDHEDKTQVFYCASDDLIRSFEDGVNQGRK